MSAVERIAGGTDWARVSLDGEVSGHVSLFHIMDPGREHVFVVWSAGGVTLDVSGDPDRVVHDVAVIAAALPGCPLHAHVIAAIAACRTELGPVVPVPLAKEEVDDVPAF